MRARGERARECEHVTPPDRRDVGDARKRRHERARVGVDDALPRIGDEQLPARRGVDAEHRARVETRIRLRGCGQENRRSDERNGRSPDTLRAHGHSPLVRMPDDQRSCQNKERNVKQRRTSAARLVPA